MAHPENADRHETPEFDTLNAIRRGVTVLVVISLFSTAYVARDLLLPILGGILIALTLRPVARGMQRLGLPAPVSAVILCLGIAVALLAAALFSAGAINTLMADSAQMQADLQRRLTRIMISVRDVQDASREVEQMTSMGENGVREVVVQQPSLLNNAMSSIGRVGATVAVALVLATFLLASGELFLIKLVQAFPRMSDKKRALNTVYDIERNVSRYLLTITLINLALGLAVTGALALIGMEYPYIWGILAFCLNFLPYIGGLIGAALVAAFAIVSFDSLAYAALAPAAYMFLTAIEGQFITPWMVGRRLEMNPVAVFLTVVVWGWLWGIPGALVAVPLLVAFKVISDNVDRLQIIGRFLGGPEAR
ncbi:AI-2E family transporter [Oceaniglobus trochenteri]|uniref:AI-2E family transporter n=1 Tax=Oceaniglobus trochenteri TaxID=2763260 RepID=UPI001CFF98DC|nr:AI-2E family transporter [Oceaniglobus trochenteri]